MLSTLKTNAQLKILVLKLKKKSYTPCFYTLKPFRSKFFTALKAEYNAKWVKLTFIFSALKLIFFIYVCIAIKWGFAWHEKYLCKEKSGI